MSTVAALIAKLKNKPKDLTWNEAIRILSHLGYNQLKSGKTSGSRRKFYNEEKDTLIAIHRPHNPEILKPYQINDILKKLEEDGVI